jgi:PhnB protein
MPRSSGKPHLGVPVGQYLTGPRGDVRLDEVDRARHVLLLVPADAFTAVSVFGSMVRAPSRDGGDSMPSRLNPYISSNGDAKQAMDFYQQVLGGTLEVNTFGEFGMTDAPADGVMHARLDSVAGYTIMLPTSHRACRTTRATTSRSASAGTTPTSCAATGRSWPPPLRCRCRWRRPVWGDEFGLLKDQFGIHWMVNISQSTAS